MSELQIRAINTDLNMFNLKLLKLKSLEQLLDDPELIKLLFKFSKKSNDLMKSNIR